MSNLFSRRNGRRIKQGILRVERQPRQTDPKASDYTAAMRPGCYAYCASGATAASGDTLGTGTAEIRVRNGADISASSGITVSFYNAGGAITGPCRVLLTWADGAWSGCVAPC